MLSFKMFRGYKKNIEKDLKSFLSDFNLDINKIKISQSERNGSINLTIIYEV